MRDQTANPISTRHIHPESVRWTIFAGCALIVLGILAILAPLLAGVAIEALVAWVLIFGGISHFVLAWHVRGTGAHIWEALIGLTYLSVGGYVFLHPLAGLIGLTAMLGAYLLVKGIFEIVAGLPRRTSASGTWLILDGSINFILAVFIWSQYAFTASWVIGALIGISILFTGISRLALGILAGKERILRLFIVRCARVVCSCL